MKFELSEQDRSTLNRWVKSRAVGEKQTLRTRIVLMTADRMPSRTIMGTLKISAPTLNLWHRRFVDCGIDGLKKGKTRPSRVPPLPMEKLQEVLTLTMTGKPAHATHWSCRTMAEQAGISRMAVHRIWREHQLKPHRVKGFKVSNDPQFEEKLRDVVGLYWTRQRKPSCFPWMRKAKSRHRIVRNRVYRQNPARTAR